MSVDKIFKYLFLLLVPSVILSFALNSMVLISATILSLWLLKDNLSKFPLKKYLLFNAFTFSVLLGILIDLFQANLFDAHELIKRMSFLMMPLIILTSSEKLQRLGLKVYVYFLTLLSSVILIAGIVRAFVNKGQIIYGNWDSDTTEQFYKHDMILNWGELSYHRLFFLFDMHPSYYAFFSVIAIVILAFSGTAPLKKSIKWFIIILHALMIVLLSSKTGIISLLAIFIFFLFRISSTRQLMTGILSFLILVLIIAKVPSTEIRVKSALDSFMMDDLISVQNSTSERMILWKSMGLVDHRELAFGIGHHGAHQKIIELTGIDKNMHNQFLQSILSSGFLGFICLILFVISPLIWKRNAFAWSLVMVVFINLLFENMLDRVWGITAISFFYGLLIFGSSELTNFDKIKEK